MPPAGPEHIGTLGTLNEIVQFLAESTGSVGADPRIAAEEITASDRTEPRTPVAARPDDGSAVTRVLLEAVSEKTGYPVEMLELDMRLDADLGIDSIKRVEIFSAVQERLPETTAIGPDQTGTLQTLRQIVEFLSGGPGPDPTPPPSPVRSRPSENGHHGASAGRNGKVHDEGSHLSHAEPSRNGHGHSHGHRAVVLRCLEPRAVPLASSSRRESVKLPAGGTIWITDDGSALTGALRHLLVDRGYRVNVFADGGVAPSAPESSLCGLIVLAPRTGRTELRLRMRSG